MYRSRSYADTDFVYFKAVSKSNWKRLRWLFEKLYDIKCIILALKLYRDGI